MKWLRSLLISPPENSSGQEEELQSQEYPQKKPTEDLGPHPAMFGHRFAQPQLLEQALTHKSFHNENSNRELGHNEVLELLGDSVLGLVLTELLMSKFPEDAEGKLSKKRASLVNESTLSEIALRMKLDVRIKLGRGEQSTGVAKNPRILASAFEAILGAIYKDGGFVIAKGIVTDIFNDVIDQRNWSHDFHLDYKSRLQEITQERYGAVPMYKLQEELGPEHNKRFEVSVRVNGRVLGLGWGGNKKQAEQESARMALENL